MNKDTIGSEDWQVNKRTHEEINTDRIIDEIKLFLESIEMMKDCHFEKVDIDLERDELKDLMVNNHGLIFRKEKRKK